MTHPTLFSGVTLKTGSHRLPSEGSCAMEVAILAAGYGWTEVRSAQDLPPCMSRTIGAYVIRINDAMPDDWRQKLLPSVVRMSGSAALPEIERERAEYLVMNAAKPAAVMALRSAGMLDHAQAVERAVNISDLRTAAEAAVAAAVATADAVAWAAAKAVARAAEAAQVAWAAAEAAATAAEAAQVAWAAAEAAARAARAAAEAAVATADAVAWAAAEAAAEAAARAAEAAQVAWAAAAHGSFDWQPFIDALDGALCIGPQADEIETGLIDERVKALIEA